MSALIIFIEKPDDAKAEKGLAKDIGEVPALAVREQLQAHLRNITKDFSGEKFLFYPDYPNWNDAWDISIYRKRIQEGDTPGDRMAAAFDAVFEEGHDRAMILGNDCYELTPEIILEGMEALTGNDVVVGPADDGSNYLLGMKSLHPALLKNTPVQVDDAPARTSIVLPELGLSCYMLPTLRVLDTAEDLSRSGLQTG